MIGQTIALVLLWLGAAALLAHGLHREAARPKPATIAHVRQIPDLRPLIAALTEMAEELAKLDARGGLLLPGLSHELEEFQQAFAPLAEQQRLEPPKVAWPAWMRPTTRPLPWRHFPGEDDSS